jgi:uncharacterized membrane protein YfcA
MKEKIIVSTATLATSLLSYFYAKEVQKDVMPYVMIGGFVGAMLGEIIVTIISKDEKKEDE